MILLTLRPLAKRAAKKARAVAAPGKKPVPPLALSQRPSSSPCFQPQCQLARASSRRCRQRFLLHPRSSPHAAALVAAWRQRRCRSLRVRGRHRGERKGAVRSWARARGPHRDRQGLRVRQAVRLRGPRAHEVACGHPIGFPLTDRREESQALPLSARTGPARKWSSPTALQQFQKWPLRLPVLLRPALEAQRICPAIARERWHRGTFTHCRLRQRNPRQQLLTSLPPLRPHLQGGSLPQTRATRSRIGACLLRNPSHGRSKALGTLPISMAPAQISQGPRQALSQ